MTTYSQPQTVIVQQQPLLLARPEKSLGLAYLFLLFFGFLGVHQFYLGKIGRGVLYLFTFGLLGIGVLVDLFTLPAQTKMVNTMRAIGQR